MKAIKLIMISVIFAAIQGCGNAFEVGGSGVVSSSSQLGSSQSGFPLKVEPLGNGSHEITANTITQVSAGMTLSWLMSTNLNAGYNDAKYSAITGANLIALNTSQLPANFSGLVMLKVMYRGTTQNLDVYSTPLRIILLGSVPVSCEGTPRMPNPDFDLDGDVDEIDLRYFRTQLGTSSVKADFNCNGFVNSQDYAIFLKYMSVTVTTTPTPALPLPTVTAAPPTPTVVVSPPTPTADSLKPFWRKPTNGDPTWAPSWYANKGQVTRRINYDSSKTAKQNGDTLQAAIESISAGDYLELGAGYYQVSSTTKLSTNASAANPSVIAAAPGASVTIYFNATEQNLFELVSGKYLIIERIFFKGGDRSFRVMSFENLFFYNNEVAYCDNNAISANDSNTSYLFFVDNNIHHTNWHGEGLYLGSGEYSANAITHHSKVIGNYIHDLNGPNNEQGDGIEIKYGSYLNEIKYNFVRGGYYPGIISWGSFRTSAEVNIFEENIVIGSEDRAMQITGDGIIRNNLLIGVNAYAGLSLLNARNLTVVNNTILNNGIGVDNSFGGANIVFANNAIYSTGVKMKNGNGNAIVVNNVHLTSLNSFANLSMDGVRLDPTPLAGSAMINAGSSQYAPLLDIFGRARSAPDVGAAERP